MTIAIPCQPEIESTVDAEFDDENDRPSLFWHKEDKGNPSDSYEATSARFIEEMDEYCFPDPVIIPPGKQLVHCFDADINRKLEMEFGFEVSANSFAR